MAGRGRGRRGAGGLTVPQPVLRTDRLVLEPLADRHLELEVELDSDAEVLRYLSSRAHTAEETRVRHAHRMERGREVDGLGMWMGFLGDTRTRDSSATARC